MRNEVQERRASESGHGVQERTQAEPGDYRKESRGLQEGLEEKEAIIKISSVGMKPSETIKKTTLDISEESKILLLLPRKIRLELLMVFLERPFLDCASLQEGDEFLAPSIFDNAHISLCRVTHVYKYTFFYEYLDGPDKGKEDHADMRSTFVKKFFYPCRIIVAKGCCTILPDDRIELIEKEDIRNESNS